MLVQVELGATIYLQTYKIFSEAILQTGNLCEKTTFLPTPLEFRWKPFQGSTMEKYCPDNCNQINKVLWLYSGSKFVQHRKHRRTCKPQHLYFPNIASLQFDSICTLSLASITDDLVTQSSEWFGHQIIRTAVERAPKTSKERDEGVFQ